MTNHGNLLSGEPSLAIDTTPQRHLRLGELLLKQQKLSVRDLEQALAAQTEMGGLFGRVLISLGLVSELDLASALAAQLRFSIASSSMFPTHAIELDVLDADYLVAHGILPLSVDDGQLRVAMTTPQDEFLRKALSLATGLQIEPYLGIESELRDALARLYGKPGLEAGNGDLQQLDSAESPEDSEFVERLKDLASEAPVIRVVNTLMSRVIDLRASDIHIEPFEDGLYVRYRVDGVLQRAEVVEATLGAAVTSRIKLLAHLNIAERRLPQDGRIRTRIKGRELDLRISTLPTVHGESVVIRVLDRESIRMDLGRMGFSSENLERYVSLISKPHGIVLVTGPTGSGKTTTLYASLARLDADALKILTVEDPVEYQMQGINQVHVQPQIGLTFAHALRSILRQDPDIIMIGEMRDAETAQIAVQSALTGHLVFSTLHTNTAAGAIVRLEDMGIERYLVTSCVNGVLSQRLVRMLCPHCKQRTYVRPSVLGIRANDGELAQVEAIEVFKATGCELCKQTGYLGRTSVHELLVMTDVIRDAVLDGADASTLHRVACEQGMKALYQDGIEKVLGGVTSIEELLRITTSV